MQSFAITLTCLFIGIALKRLPIIPRQTGKLLNLFVIYISLPALILLKIPELSFSRHLLVPAVMPWVMLLISFVLVVLAARFFQWNRATTGCMLLLIPLGNTSFLGIPMVETFFGKQALPYAVLYDQLGSFLALAIYGSLIIALYGSGANKPTVASVGKKIISFPPFIALMLAFILSATPYPASVIHILDFLASTLLPLIMIAVGFQLTLNLSKEVQLQLTIGLAIKMIAAPALALFICTAAGLKGEAVQVSIFESAMPPMASAGALAIMANLSPALASALVGIGILVSFVTLPVLYLILV